jgi:large subunit ribosomal protein L4e
MKELTVISLKGQQSKQKLPEQFSELVRPDLIRRAVLAIASRKRQPYGTDPQAGKRVSADLSKRRRKYRGSYGSGQSRTHRKIHSRRGRQMFMVGALAPHTRGGFLAHPPKAERVWAQKINKKERRKAIRSAMSATIFKDIVKERGHKVPDNYPFIADDDFSALSKASEVRKALQVWGFTDELRRSAIKKVRAGRGKSRGRKYKRRKGLLLVVDEKCPISKAARNIAGVDVTTVSHLGTNLLAPGGDAGRATIFTKKAIEKLAKEKLYL